MCNLLFFLFFVFFFFFYELLIAHNPLSWNVLFLSCNPICQLCLGGPGYSSRTVKIGGQSSIIFIVLNMAKNCLIQVNTKTGKGTSFPRTQGLIGKKENNSEFVHNKQHTLNSSNNELGYNDKGPSTYSLFPRLTSTGRLGQPPTPRPSPLLNVHLKFCCPKNHCIPVRILTCTFYVKMSPIYCFKTW